MQVVIPAAGFATRMRPLSLTRAKSMIPVAGKPIIGHILDQIGNLADRIVLVVGENGLDIPAYVRSLGYNVDYVVQRNEEMLGLGYAVSLTEDKVRKDTPLLIVLGDTPFRMDLSKAVERGDFIGVKEVKDPRRFGVVRLVDGYVADLIEKPETPPSNLAIVGIYYFTDVPLLYDSLRYILKNDIKTRGEYQLTDALKEMIERGWKVRAVEIDEWLDCGTLDQTLISQRRLLEWNTHFKRREDVVFIPPVYVSDSATVRRSVIGPNVHIDEGSVIEDSVIRDSIILPNAHVKEIVLEGSFVGERAKLTGEKKRLRISDYSDAKV
ncbi:MAG: NTP transferase domain-containing protein [Thermotogae bacterium]|nr:NTP transferase domain-containing protein [Thermotogota bacterium]